MRWIDYTHSPFGFSRSETEVDKWQIKHAGVADQIGAWAMACRRLEQSAKVTISGSEEGKGYPMRSISAKDAKYGFGRLIDLAHAEPALVAKHGRPAVMVLSVEEYEKAQEQRERQR